MTEQEKWAAVLRNDAGRDGSFFYAVQSTKIFCRPSCASKPPKRGNVRFFDTAQEAQAAGYRPCKRCRPDMAAYDPSAELAAQMRARIEQAEGDRARMEAALRLLGMSPSQQARVFKEHYGSTPAAYAQELRANRAKDYLRSQSILDTACLMGFDSVPAFYAFFRKYVGCTPGEYQRVMKNEE